MLKKSLIAAAAIAAVFTVAAPAEQASAKTNIDIHLGFGGWGPGYGYGYGPGHGYGHRPYRPHWGVSCFTGKRIVRNHGFRNIHAVDCSRPVYQYRAWRFGNPYRVKVGVGGNILSVRPL